MGVNYCLMVRSSVFVCIMFVLIGVSVKNSVVFVDKFDLSEWYIILFIDENNDGKFDNILVKDI